MRTRSKQSDPILAFGSLRWRQIWNGVTYPWNWFGGNSGSNDIYYNTQTMTDQKTPGYFRAVREGTAIPVSPMSSTKETIVKSIGRYQSVHSKNTNPTNDRWEYDVDGYHYAGNALWGTTPTAPTVDGSIALQEALSRAQNDCYDALTFAAEFRKTVEGVITLRSRSLTIFERFDERVRSSARKRRYRGMEMAQILAEIWLEMRYMWRPLVYDMYAMEEAIRRLAAGIEDPLQRAYASREGTNQSTSSGSTGTINLPGVTGGVAGLSCIYSLSTVVERKVHAAVGLKVTTREITMVDPVVTAWELVPFSFVLDWFVTIGTMLSAFSPFATGQLQYASLATTTTTTYVSNFTLVPAAGYSRVSGSPQTLTHTRIVEKYDRVKATPTPTLAVDIDLNVSKILDLVALALVINKKLLTRLLRHF